ncbi:MAG: helix-turn-helix domain-containing protein, partial [Candidatus Ornithospirochaeta sp.]
MDQEKVGRMIRTLRKDRNMTQKDLADMLFVTDRAVSKWERGLGCPDVSLLARLGEIFSVDIKSILQGNMEEKSMSSGNMKKTKFYVCPICRNMVVSTEDAGVSCCSRTLENLEEKKAGKDTDFKVERIDGTELFVSSSHSMTKDNYISFVAYVTSDSLLVRKLYPEWEVSLRLPWLGHGKVMWYSEKEGLQY